MIVKSNEEFKEAVLKTLSFSKTYSDNYTLYRNKNKPELGIAYKVGYNYSANFSKMFKKTYGKTPVNCTPL